MKSTVEYDNEGDRDYFPTPNRNDIEEETNEVSKEDTINRQKTPSRYVQKNHLESKILGEDGSRVQTRRNITGTSSYLALPSSIEPQSVNEAYKYECWVKAMDE